MALDDLFSCPECGASTAAGKRCWEKYGEMLALEFESPAVFGRAHHITVMCYNLQHPDGFTDEALAWMRTSLRAVIEDGLSPRELRERARKGLAGNVKVKRRPTPAGSTSKARWSMTVMDVRMDGPEVYVGDVTAWARYIITDLDKMM